jgi:hypothetical protein
MQRPAASCACADVKLRATRAGRSSAQRTRPRHSTDSKQASDIGAVSEKRRVNDCRPSGRYGHRRHYDATGMHSSARDFTCRMPTGTSSKGIGTSQTVDECTMDQGINEGTVDPLLLRRETTCWFEQNWTPKHQPAKIKHRALTILQLRRHSKCRHQGRNGGNDEADRAHSYDRSRDKRGRFQASR